MKTNLPAKDKQITKFKKVASGKREIHFTHHTFCRMIKVMK